MGKIKGIFNKNFVLGESSGNLFGGFVEHMGRVVYGGLYEPDHCLADEEGFRKDVIELAKGLSMPLIRYPGGNFVSAYDWRTGIGPKEKRKMHFDPAWNEWEKNEFALDEFISWCRKVGTEAGLVMNLGTGSEEMNLALFDYCNGNDGSFWSEKRKEYASKEPYHIRYFFLGNEMSSPRQPGYKKVEEYAEKTSLLAKKLKAKDPFIQLVLSGSSCRNASVYGYWDDRILEECYEYVDFLSLHAYFGPKGEDKKSFLASDLFLDKHIKEVIAICDAVGARKKSDKKIMLSLDEWNIWSGTNKPIVPGRKDFEEIYTALDAVVLGGLLMTIMENSNRLKIACLAQLCNILAPIMTENGGKAWKQSIYYPFSLSSRFGRGKVLQSVVKEENQTLPSGKVTAVWEEKSSMLSLFLYNRSMEKNAFFEITFENFTLEECREEYLIAADEPEMVNTVEKENVKLQKSKDALLRDNTFSVTLPAKSWGLFRMKVKEGEQG